MTTNTPEEIMNDITKLSSRNERVSWDRKMDNLVKLIAKIKPYEDQILDLILQKQPLLDEVAALRHTMVKECVHPREQLVYKNNPGLGDHVECKFCNKTFSVIEHK